YMHDGQKWNKAKPPATPVLGSEPVAAPEGGEPKAKRSSVLPARLFSAAPAGRSGGMPRGALIVIIAVIAVVVVAILVGGVLFVSNLVGGSSTAKVTTTPTRSLAILPSPVIPTITLARPTDTPLPPPTVEVTIDITPTRTPAAVRPTATKAPTTKPAGPTATATVNVPPGLYVTKVESNPAKPSIGSSVGFHVTFLNTTGSVQVYVWQVLVYKCPEQCDSYKSSYGQTLRMTSNIGTGTVVLDSPQNINLGAGLNCDLVAIPNFVDQTNQQVVPFTSLKGNPLYYSFNVCN
ncbi:MAG TPA: hypothetical protein VF478_04265, partial [Anaerolineae bacterium]